MKVQALGSTVVLKQHAKETALPSGIVLSSKYAEEKTVGDVVSVGPDYDMSSIAGVDDPVLSEGDTVIFRNAQRTRIGDEEFLFVNADDVLAVLREE